MPRKGSKKTTATQSPAADVKPEHSTTLPVVKDDGTERRVYQVTNIKEGKVAGTSKVPLTKKEALDLGFPWADTDPTKRRKRNTGDGS